MMKLYLSAQINQFIEEPDVKRVDTPDKTVKAYHQQFSHIYPSATNVYHRFSRVMRKRGNPYWMPRTPDNQDRRNILGETNFQEVVDI